MKVLCVAEKPSIAKAVANHLGGGAVNTVGQFPRSCICTNPLIFIKRSVRGAQYTKNYEFQYNFPAWGRCDVIMTSVLGHLISQDFDSQYKSWMSCDPISLFEANITTYVDNDKKPIADNIEQQARYAQMLYIWTDCDREGENIGTEIRDVAAKGNQLFRQPGKTVRARFSNIEHNHVVNAACNPIPLDEMQSNAVASRIELDLRIGASFTRQLTLSIQNLLPANADTGKRQVVSYGGCQFPTLGFVVDRYFRVRNFIPEAFWGINVMHEKNGIKVKFSWSRGHLFDRMAVVILYERCLVAKFARITKVQTRPTSKWKPLPLTTVELQKCVSRFLRMDSQRAMKIAEDLYNKGWISYPRTETDQFDKDMNLQALCQKQTQGGPWAQFAQGLVVGGFSAPRNGRNNDKAHPPIHPVNFVNPTQLSADEKQVHEFVVRRFLACCSEDARGSMTEIKMLYGTEDFIATGLTVLERNYLDVYPYDRWTSSQELPEFKEGETFEPTEANMYDGKTGPPGYLTEPELIGLMDANGIGTDATMAEHIAKVQERQYVTTRPRGARAIHNVDDEVNGEPHQEQFDRGHGRGGGRGRGRGRGGRSENSRSSGSNGVKEFIPTTLGVALVVGSDNIGHEISLAKPFLRKEVCRPLPGIVNSADSLLDGAEDESYL
nr:dna topoisomerase 3 [Quercus suber]